MRSGEVALRLSILFAVAGFITMAAGIYEIDRREKSSSENVTANLTGIEQRLLVLNDQIRILNDQYTTEFKSKERQISLARHTNGNTRVASGSAGKSLACSTLVQPLPIGMAYRVSAQRA